MANALERLSIKLALLSIVNEYPEEPVSSKADEDSPRIEDAGSRTLSLKHEILLSQHLAFLCAYSDDPLHVLAVCVEEDQAANRIRIRLAANTGVHDGLMKDLEAVCLTLEDEAQGVNRPENVERLLAEVVRMNQRRVLSRMRSKHASNPRIKSKAPLQRRLLVAEELLVKNLPDRPPKQKLLQDLDTLTRKVTALEDMSSADANSSAAIAPLVDIVKLSSSLLGVHRSAIRCIPHTPGRWDPRATAAFIERLEKVGHYEVACRAILRVARRYSIFRNIRATFFNVQEQGPMLSARSLSNFDPVLNSTCNKAVLKKIANKGYGSVINVRQSIREKMVQDSRLHAEIQLLMHYEKNSTQRPRVISSSKSPCYLCHTLFKLHGGYFIHSSHGTVYETWRWPSERANGRDPCLSEILPRFMATIDENISNAPTRNVRRRYQNHAAESRVDIIASLTPSVVSFISRSSTACGSKTRSVRSLRASPTDNAEPGIREGDSILAAQLGTHILAQSETPALAPSIVAPAKKPGNPNATTSKMSATPMSSTTNGYSPLAVGAEEGTRSEDENCTHNKEDRSLDKQILQPRQLAVGETQIYSFDNNSSSFLIHLPGLHVELEWNPSPSNNVSQSNNPVPGNSRFVLEVKHLDIRSNPVGESPAATTINLEGDWVEKRTPEDVLLSKKGLILHHNQTFLRLQAITR